MSKIKSIFVTAIVFLMLAIITLACSQLCKPAFVIIIGFMSSIGFAGCTIAFCRWLQKPAEVKEEYVAPVEIEKTESDLDFESVWDEVKREESEARSRV